jgi:hypothetical protein
LQVSGFIFYKHGDFEYYLEVAGAVNLFTNRNQVHLLNLLPGAKKVDFWVGIIVDFRMVVPFPLQCRRRTSYIPVTAS